MTTVDVEPWNNGVRGEQVRPLIESEALVIRVSAGPGTGKTFGLARRVVRLLHPLGVGLPGSEVLVVAFNRVIAADLARNIGEELTRSGCAGEMPVVRTIHALCLASLASDAPRLLLPDEVDCMLYDVQTAHEAIRAAYPAYNDLSQALPLSVRLGVAARESGFRIAGRGMSVRDVCYYRGGCGVVVGA